MAKKTTPLTNNEQTTSGHEDHGNFAVGLFLGFVTGMAGVALFHTDEGREVWEKMKQEFRTSLQELQERATQEEPPKSKGNSNTTAQSEEKRFPKFQLHRPKS